MIYWRNLSPSLIVLFHKLDCDFCIAPKVLELLDSTSTKLPIACFFRSQQRVGKNHCPLPGFSNIFSLLLTVMLLRWHLTVLWCALLCFYRSFVFAGQLKPKLPLGADSVVHHSPLLLFSRHCTPFCSLSAEAFWNGIIHFGMLLYILTPLLIPNSDTIHIGNPVFIYSLQKKWNCSSFSGGTEGIFFLFQDALRGFYGQWLVCYFGCNIVLV